MTTGALPYCVKDEATFLAGLNAVNKCTYGNDDLFVNYKGQANVFVEFSSLAEKQKNEQNQKSKRGRVIFLQHGLSGIAGLNNSYWAGEQYTEFEVMVKNLKGETAKNGFKFESLGIITKRKTSIKEIKNKNTYNNSIDGSTYLFFNDVKDKEKADKIGINNLIYEKTKEKNILIRTEFSTGQRSFAIQLEEMKDIVNMIGKLSDEIDVTFIGHSMGGIASINYGIDYAKENLNKNIDIITISTPYRSNSLAQIAANLELPADIISPVVNTAFKGIGVGIFTEAKEDLSSEERRKELIQKWKKRTRNIELCAIGVSKAGLEHDERAIELGDGVVDLESQLGGDFPDISSKYLVVYKDYESKLSDAAATKHKANHSNTPDMLQVIDIVKDSIKK